MTGTCGIMGSGWFAGIFVGVALGLFFWIGVYLVAEDWWSARYRNQRGGTK